MRKEVGECLLIFFTIASIAFCLAGLADAIAENADAIGRDLVAILACWVAVYLIQRFW